MMNNFTPRAQQVLALARKEADRFNHNYVGTEHLLLGLIKLVQGGAVNVLQKRGLDRETVRMAVEKQVGAVPATRKVGELPEILRGKKELGLAGKQGGQLVCKDGPGQPLKTQGPRGQSLLNQLPGLGDFLELDP